MPILIEVLSRIGLKQYEAAIVDCNIVYKVKPN